MSFTSLSESAAHQSLPERLPSKTQNRPSSFHSCPLIEPTFGQSALCAVRDHPGRYGKSYKGGCLICFAIFPD